ncbi:hypothetical protein [Paraburkholderia tropica]|uniref:hypothetical protein n=1 Tax=Paraburkholderia tropica TaxID=92647 RepID=UPI002AB7DA67|nr:hypothetical protein [Paraburkholderia tropica]
MNARKFWPVAVSEYLTGLYASGLLARILIPTVALAITGAILVGMLDAASGWRLKMPLWAHIASTLAFAVAVAKLVAGHIRRTREIGRRSLSGSGEA